MGGRIHHREAHGGPAEVPQRSRRGPQWSTTATQHVRAAQHAAWENDTSTGSPKRSCQIHGGHWRTIHQREPRRGPAEVPPHTRRSTRCTQPLVRSIWSAEAITTKFGKNLDLRGCTQSESQESKAPNPNPNDFILETRSGSQKSADGYRDQDHENKQWSAEAITVRGIINIIVEVDDRGSSQTRQLKIIPQLKSQNLAGVFRYWLEAIRTVIDSTLSPVHTGFLTYSLVLNFTLNN